MTAKDPDVVLDREQLRNITMEDEDLMREIVAALIEDAEQQIRKFGEAVQRGQAQECVRLAHSARGACGNVGAAALAALFSSLETEAKAGDLAQCRKRMGALSTELEKLREEARSI